jgi:hypothetical protein
MEQGRIIASGVPSDMLPLIDNNTSGNSYFEGK